MSSTTAIGDVSRALFQLLQEELASSDPEIVVTLLAPDEASRGSGKRVNLFLHRVAENAELKNLDWQVQPDTNKLAKQMPPLALNLFYQLTPYAPNDDQFGQATAHDILGQAMQVFHEHPVIARQNTLNGNRELVQIMLSPSNLEELNHLWDSFSLPFRLSMLYEVSVVQLVVSEPYVAQDKDRVRRANVVLGGPVLDRIEPNKGPAGTEVTVYGRHFVAEFGNTEAGPIRRGWQPKVTWRSPVDGQEQKIDVSGGLDNEGRLVADTFKFVIPEGLPLSVVMVRVDISDLCRRTFAFEVEEDHAGPKGSE